VPATHRVLGRAAVRGAPYRVELSGLGDGSLSVCVGSHEPVVRIGDAAIDTSGGTGCAQIDPRGVARPLARAPRYAADPQAGSWPRVRRVDDGRELWSRPLRPSGTEGGWDTATAVMTELEHGVVVRLTSACEACEDHSRDAEHRFGRAEVTTIFAFDESGTPLGTWAITTRNARVSLSLEGGAFLTGDFDGLAELDPGPREQWVASNGGSDGFVLRLVGFPSDGLGAPME
jgi:hypothetical protein